MFHWRSWRYLLSKIIMGDAWHAIFEGIVIHIVSIPLLIPVAFASLQFYARLANASNEAVSSLTQRLKFPFSMIGHIEAEAVPKLIKNGPVWSPVLFRIFFSALPVMLSVQIVLNLFTQPYAQDYKIATAIWLIPYLFTVVASWRFGHRLLTNTYSG